MRHGRVPRTPPPARPPRGIQYWFSSYPFSKNNAFSSNQSRVRCRIQYRSSNPFPEPAGDLRSFLVGQATPEFTASSGTRDQQPGRRVAPSPGEQLDLRQQTWKCPMPLRSAATRIDLDCIFVYGNDLTITVVTNAQVQTGTEHPHFQCDEWQHQPQHLPGNHGGNNDRHATYPDEEPLCLAY